METQIITVNDNPHQHIRIDMFDDKKLICVLNVPMEDIGQLIKKLEWLQFQNRPESQPEPKHIIMLDPTEPPQMTAVLGPKPDPTGWYRRSLEQVASQPEPLTTRPQHIVEPAPPMPKPKQGKGIINIVGVRSKDHTSYGHKYEGKVNTNYNADIVKGKSIRIYGLEPNRSRYDKETRTTTSYTLAFDLTFKIGDEAVHGSYNLIYTGKIVRIGEKTVTIQKDGYDRNVVLDIETFIRRNYDYDAKKVFEHNSTESYYL